MCEFPISRRLMLEMNTADYTVPFLLVRQKRHSTLKLENQIRPHRYERFQKKKKIFLPGDSLFSSF